ncbi:MAG TPA: hypothetical protein VL086_15485 [Candidatus Nitrosotalea sp.]|nr:hypothetical protein [Candidatus Nitrosotalea sp.]
MVYPNGKYVLLGDGVTQAWQWIWVSATPPPPPPPSAPAPPTRRPDDIQAPSYRPPIPQKAPGEPLI